MKLIRSLMGRRQFLIAAGVTSTSALAFNKLAAFANPAFQTGAAVAAEKAGMAYDKGDYIDTGRYSHLLSPLKIGNIILKTRMYSMNAVVHFLQGPEIFPAEPSRFYAANLAKNGAAIVTCRLMWDRVRSELQGDSAHMVIYDLEDYGVQNYIDQLVEGIHCYSAKASAPVYVLAPGQVGPTANPALDLLSANVSRKVVEEAVTNAKYFQSRGFDMVRLDMSQFKGEIKTRVGFNIDVCQAIKKACGQDFLIETALRVSEAPTGRNLWASTMEDAIQQAKMLEGLVDLLAVGSVTVKGWTQDREPYPIQLRYTHAIKESGAKIAVAPYFGFQDLDLNEEHIATGKADMIGMGNAWIADWEYGKKAYEGRGEDVVPCIRCDKCHGLSFEGPWYSLCSVNPKLGIDTAVRIIDPPTVSKKVAVIGGGPAGMKAAITASERGHRVTLYEKNIFLGGLLRHSDFSPYKWPLKDFKDYLVRQVNKAGIEVVLGTSATPDMIEAKGYDAILVALGADPVIPLIPGADGKNVWNVVNVYGKEKDLGKNVVLIGGGEIGAETGMYLARAGHNITAMTNEKQFLAPKGPHQQATIIGVYEKMDNFSIITEVTTTGILEGRVTYKDASGGEKSVQADSVVIYAGFEPRQNEAMKFSGSAGQIFIIGDCSGIGGGVQKSQRSAFFAASQV